ERGQRSAVAQEARGAVGEGEVGAARMAAAEGTAPILQRGHISPARHPVVDWRLRAERDLEIGPEVRDVAPPPNAAERRYSGPNNERLAVEFRIVMIALAEEERVTGAVTDVRQPNTPVNEEDAVLGHAGQRNRPCAGVAAVTAHPI